jgi:pathogenesis-related protein 1
MILAAVLLLQSVFLNACQAQRPASFTPPAVKPQGASPGRLAENLFSGSRIPLQEAGQIVTLHNAIRAEVGVGPVIWSEKLAAYAQQWADHLVSSWWCRMKHRPNSGKWQEEYGENLFIGTAGQYGTSDAVMAWAAEKPRYHGEALQSFPRSDAGHYTQMVWRDTTQIGCATGMCKGNLLVVCNYDPPGNFLGRKPY